MRTTVESVEPYVFECRETVKLIVGHLMAVKGGETARMREALHEARALRELSRRARFHKVAQLAASMECLIEASEPGAVESGTDTLEVLCDMCAHVVLYVDTVLLYADTVAMVIEFPWMRDALTRRLRNFTPEGLLGDPEKDESHRAAPDEPVFRVTDAAHRDCPQDTLAQLQAIFEQGAQNDGMVVDVSRVEELPLWLLGTLMSYHVTLRSRGRQVRLTGLRDGSGASNEVLRRLSDRFDGHETAGARV
jgi:hypothetical protein